MFIYIFIFSPACNSYSCVIVGIAVRDVGEQLSVCYNRVLNFPNSFPSGRFSQTCSLFVSAIPTVWVPFFHSSRGDLALDGGHLVYPSTLLPQGVHNDLQAGKAQCPGVLAAQQVPVSSLEGVFGVTKETPNPHFEDKMYISRSCFKR